MQFLRFTTHSGPVQVGVSDGETVYPLPDAGSTIDVSSLSNPAYLRSVRQRMDHETTRTLDRDAVQPLAPVPEPGEIVCVGLNYHDHAEEQNEAVPETPLLFGKLSSAVTDPDAPIYHPRGIEQVDYEVELGVVIGERARHVSTDEAREYVAGYTAINDVSARDAQFDDGQFLRGKSYDSFAPMGPTLVPEPELNPHSLAIACRVNGETKQESNTEQFIFDVDEVVSYISDITTLHPGDVISTGTPGGVGIFRDPPELLEPGDEVEIEIDGIGTLRNPVVSEE